MNDEARQAQNAYMREYNRRYRARKREENPEWYKREKEKACARAHQRYHGPIGYHSNRKFRENAKRASRKHSKTSLRARFTQYRGQARRKGREFALSFEEACALFERPCAYCGLNPPLHNGIDRVDNTKGYILTNVVPCCSECNFAKHAYTRAQFLQKVEEIYAYRK